ncbi:MAG: amino acid ABC transporter permease [Bacilli bacterium]|jgi:putative lysine transport system permease protein|nr:amino acid ABC transporter permease [Bacilli bacterium]
MPVLASSGDDIQYILQNQGWVKWLWQGIAGTIVLSVIGTIGGLFLGIFLAFGKNITIRKNQPWYQKLWRYPIVWLCTIYSIVIRGTPMMVQALIFQYGCLSLFGLNWNLVLHDVPIFNGWFIAGLIIITFNTAAYMGEIVQAGLNGIGKDQIEGARSLGMSDYQTLMKVTLPQALRNSIPTVGNEWIVNIKDSSVLNVISVTELFFEGKTIAGASYKYMAIYLIIAFIYLVLTLLTTGLLKIISMKMDGKKFTWKFFHYKEFAFKGDML